MMKNKVESNEKKKEPIDNFLKINEVMKIVGFGRTWIYDEIKKNKFPKQVEFSKGAVRWSLNEIAKYMDNKKATRKIEVKVA